MAAQGSGSPGFSTGFSACSVIDSVPWAGVPVAVGVGEPGVGLAVAVPRGVALAVGLAVTLALDLGVGVADSVGLALIEALGRAVTLWVGLAVSVALGLAVALWVCVAVGLEDRVGVGVSAPTTPNQLVDVGWSATIVTVCGWLPVVTDGAYGSPGPARFTLSTAGPAGTSRLKNPNASVTAVCVTPQPGEYTNTCTFGRLGWLPCTPLRS
jgi:hypothetical protein